MARIFLDTNSFIDITEQRDNLELEDFEGHKIFISPLSVHIYTYTYKIKAPIQKLSKFVEKMHMISFTGEVVLKSLTGPTNDFEDNVQLHSAADAECDYFLTSDEKLLGMKFFGKTKIVDTLTS